MDAVRPCLPILATLISACAPLRAQVFSNGYTRFDLGIEPGITAPLAGDFTGDGMPDLLVHMTSEIRVYPGQGNGVFGAPLRTPLPEPEPRKYAHGAVVGDFNVDGKLDLFAFGRIFLGSGDGRLQFLTNVAVQDRPQVFDINKDGLPDLSGMTTPSSYGIMLGTADGKFSGFYGDPWFEVFPVRLGAVADLNADGRLDLLADEGQGRVVAYLLNTDLQPLPPRSPFTRAGGSMNWSGWTFSLTDVTGDKLPDLLTAGGYGALALQKGFGDGSFGPVQKTAPVDQYFDEYLDFSVSDLDRDGIPDIAATYYYDDRDYVAVTVHKGTGTGNFDYPIELGRLNILPNGAPSITTADWNGDGFPDLTTYDSKTIVIFLKEIFAISSASGKDVLAPGALATLYRTGLTQETATAPSLARLPDLLGGIQLRVDAPRSPYFAELLYVSPTQINFRLRPGLADGLVSLTASTPRGNLHAGMIRLDDTAPALFPNAGTLTPIPNSSAFLLTLYGTGFNGRNDNVRVVVNEKSLDPEFVGPAPEILGLDVVRVQVPRLNFSCLDAACTQLNLTAAVVVVVGSSQSNLVTVSR